MTVAGLVESPTFTPASPAPTDGIFGAGGSVDPTGDFGIVVVVVVATVRGVVAVGLRAGVVVIGVVAGVTTFSFSFSFALTIVVVVALNTISSTGGAVVVVVAAARALLVNVADALLYPDRVARTTMLEDSPADRPVTVTRPDD